MQPYQRRQRNRVAQSKLLRLPHVEQSKVTDELGRNFEICALAMGTNREPHIYLREKISMKQIIRGRRATMPWRRVA